MSLNSYLLYNNTYGCPMLCDTLNEDCKKALWYVVGDPPNSDLVEIDAIDTLHIVGDSKYIDTQSFIRNNRKMLEISLYNSFLLIATEDYLGVKSIPAVVHLGDEIVFKGINAINIKIPNIKKDSTETNKNYAIDIGLNDNKNDFKIDGSNILNLFPVTHQQNLNMFTINGWAGAVKSDAGTTFELGLCAASGNFNFFNDTVGGLPGVSWYLDDFVDDPSGTFGSFSIDSKRLNPVNASINNFRNFQIYLNTFAPWGLDRHYMINLEITPSGGVPTTQILGSDLTYPTGTYRNTKLLRPIIDIAHLKVIDALSYVLDYRFRIKYTIIGLNVSELAGFEFRINQNVHLKIIGMDHYFAPVVDFSPSNPTESVYRIKQEPVPP